MRQFPPRASVIRRALGRAALLALMPRKLGALGVLARRSRAPASGASRGEHLDAAYAWLCLAQDAGPDGGVAAWYALFTGWGASYPETTGYIVPTFLALARRGGRADARARALRMADWESEVQLPGGAVRSGTMGIAPRPAVFNTGQALFGWLGAWQEARQDVHLESLRRAAAWLGSVQDADGAWRRSLSSLTTASVHAYNVRAAWGLGACGAALSEPSWTEAASRNASWVLSVQNEAGWYASNAFADDEAPLLHTIGYTIEGMLELGALLRRDELVASARRAADQLARIHDAEGGLLGRYDAGWRATVPWRCLTGEAQVALCWLRLAELTGEASYLDLASRLLDAVLATCDMDAMPEVRGALAGSHPLGGGYLSHAWPNWATKFLLDALLLEERLRDATDAGSPSVSRSPRGSSPG